MYKNFWNLRASDRLVEWKDFRRSISEVPFDKAIEMVNELWSTAPFVTYYLSADEPNTWPDPWALLAENYYCDVAKCLGIMYTIYFSGHKSVPMEFQIYYDYEDKVRFNLAWVDGGKYILNYYPYEIVNKELVQEKNLQLLYTYSAKDLQLEKY